MTPTDDQLWRILQRGDRVKIVHFPYEFSTREYTMHDETQAAYRYLIETQEKLVVAYIDKDGYPWIEFKMEGDDGVTDHHCLMLNHDGIKLVSSADGSTPDGIS